MLDEFINKCVKGCGDQRDINFVLMSLQFASKRFFEKVNTSCIHVVSGSLAKGFMMVHTHTHTYTHTHSRSLHELTTTASGVTNLALHVTNPSSSDVTIHYTKVMNLSSTVQILPLK